MNPHPSLLEQLKDLSCSKIRQYAKSFFCTRAEQTKLIRLVRLYNEKKEWPDDMEKFLDITEEKD